MYDKIKNININNEVIISPLLHCFVMLLALEYGKPHNFAIVDEGLLLTISKIDGYTVITISKYLHRLNNVWLIQWKT